MDQRIFKTKRKLRTALFTLLNTRSFNKITVTELCRTAKIDRRTFYIHYEKVADIFEDFSDQLFDEVDQALAQNHNTPEALLAVFDHILMENFTGFKLLCLNEKHRPLIDKLQQLLFETLSKRILVNQSTGASEIILYQLTTGLVNSYVYWFKHPENISYDELNLTNIKVVHSILALIK